MQADSRSSEPKTFCRPAEGQVFCPPRCSIDRRERLAPPAAATSGLRRRLDRRGRLLHARPHLLTLRMVSLTGVHPTHYPPGLWLSLDRHHADLQDVFFNEPWFFIEGCLWGLFALTALQPSSRRLWRRSAVVACVLAAAFGVLSGLGAIPTFRTG